MKLPKIQTLYAVLSRLSKRERLIFYFTAGFVLVLLLDRLIVSPIYLSMRSLDKEIGDRKVNLKKDLCLLAQKDRILAEATRYSAFVNAPKSEEEVATILLKEIENVAGKSSVYLVDMKPAGSREAGAGKKYLVNVSCEGTMEQIAGFLYNIESSDKLLRVERYSIAPKTKESTTAQCSMSVSQIVIP